jgi:hypothetical protein
MTDTVAVFFSHSSKQRNEPEETTMNTATQGLSALRAFHGSQQSPATGEALSACDTATARSCDTPTFPKNTDVKDLRLTLGDRLDIALLYFPGRTALAFASLAAIVVIVANLVTS